MVRCTLASILVVFFLIIRPPPTSTLFPYTTLFRSVVRRGEERRGRSREGAHRQGAGALPRRRSSPPSRRSEEHTSELQSRQYLVCRLLLEKKKLKHPSQHLPAHTGHPPCRRGDQPH